MRVYLQVHSRYAFFYHKSTCRASPNSTFCCIVHALVYCVLHKHALPSKTLPTKLADVLNIVVKNAE